MGVQGLWALLAPVGRRVSVETLAGKRLAIDASIWMVQFMKAMRDEKGDMVRNAHLIGFFRRICKLLYLRTKPVFVFDGGTPALKRRTVIARRRQRENAQAKIRKSAEKLLLNRLKDIRLKEQAKDLQNQRRQQKTRQRASKERRDGVSSGPQLERQEEISAASAVAEDGDDNVTKGLKKSDSKGKSILLDGDNLPDNTKSNLEDNTAVLTKDYQEKLDAMLAASLAAEENGNLTSNASTSTAAFPSEEEASDEDEQMLLPAMHGNVDPAVLASLPPSMQLDLLVQMRERLMAENRQKYQKVKKAPEKFSELQIQAYLKTVAFRREINEVQKSAAGRGVDGVQTSRIASESNREFIFSSTFSGDREVLASAREGEIGEKQQNTSKQSLPVSMRNSSLYKSDAVTEAVMEEPRNPDEDIEVYMDERGRLRIRNKHMGIRMTRDIQRNLDLIKEKERATYDSVSNNDDTYSGWENFPSEDQFLEPLPGEKSESAKLSNRDEEPMPQIASPIEISFEDDGVRKMIDNDEDDIFLKLAAGGPTEISPEKNSKEEDSPCSSDSDWEEMSIEPKDNVPTVECNTEMGVIEDEKVICADPEKSAEVSKQISKGYLEEESDLQEAIKRSLLDLDDNECNSVSYEAILVKENQKTVDNSVSEKPIQPKDDERDIIEPMDNDGHGVKNQVLEARSVISPEKVLNVSSDISELSTLPEQLTEESSHSFRGVSIKLSDVSMADEKKAGFLAETSIKASTMKAHADSELSSMIEDNILTVSIDTPNAVPSSQIEISSHDPDSKLSDASMADEKKAGFLDETSIKACTMNAHAFSEFSSMIESNPNAVHSSQITTSSYDPEPKLERREEIYGRNTLEKDSLGGEGTDDVLLEARLEEEMRAVDEEFVSLGDEQRRLERNAESVSTEMFSECQELLQMFGLPYIIAPMEAEAQCAFMELSDLVDGIVTDDSDVFLFGARSVYKNIFDDRKYVETYLMKDVEKELGLTREKLIRMAMLLGSDYTEGVSGIGIVNAIEVVNAFPEEEGLQKFREWVESPDPTILGKTDAKSSSKAKKDATVADEKGNILGDTSDETQETKQIFMDKHRKVSKNWHIPSTFPSEAVIAAYINPQVDRSTDTFSWGKPDLLVLRKLCWEKFGWNSKKTDDLLLPVLKEYEKRETQLRIEAFYSFSERFAKIRSKRIKKAVKGNVGTDHNKMDEDSAEAEKGEASQGSPRGKSARKMRKSGEQESLEGKRKGRGRGRGKGQKRGRGRGRGPKDLPSELSESSSGDRHTGNDLPEHHEMESETGSIQTVRRSSRPRNRVKYNVNEDDGLNEVEGDERLPAECGLYANESVTGEASMSHNDDYLAVGGGFCVDEDEKVEDQETDISTDDFHGGFKSMDANEDPSLVEKNGIEGGTSSTGGLSAMPFLKRKRRKI